ncbi:hypothetical protein Tco_0120868 [Tanacetum coccineum]
MQTILQCLSSKSTAWNEFGTNIASVVICLAKKQKFNFSKLIFDGMLRNLDPNSKKFLMYPRFLQLFLNNQIENLTTVFNDEYNTPSHTKKVFANMRRQGKDFLGTMTPLFATMLIQSQAVEGEGLGQPTEPQHTPTTASPSHVEPIPTIASSSHLKKTHKHRKSKRKAIEISQSSGPTTLVADETVHEERGDKMERAATTAISLDAEQGSGNIIRTQSMATLNEPIPQGTGSAEKLQEEEREQMSVEERARLLMEFIADRKKFFAAKRVEEQRNKPPTKVEQRKKLCTYMKHMAGYKDKDFKGKSFDAIKQMFDKAYKQIEDDAEKAELKACLEIVPGDDSAVNIESLATKYPIVDWKTHIPAEDKMYYQIIRADGSTKYYKIFSAMLDDFDRQDVLDLYRLVKERFESTSPKGYDILLWGDVIILFKPSEEDEIWNAQQDYTLISWRLYDSCGVHLLLMDTGITIHMMVEKKYPLTQEMLSRMLSRKLKVDHKCEMAYELLRFTKSQYKK